MREDADRKGKKAKRREKGRERKGKVNVDQRRLDLDLTLHGSKAGAEALKLMGTFPLISTHAIYLL
jgi:hypothetical protein